MQFVFVECVCACVRVLCACMRVHVCICNCVLLYCDVIVRFLHPQENINWSFTEVAISPLPVIDVIDKNVSSVSR